MKKVYFVGLDIAKNVFQIFLADEKGKQIKNQKISRAKVIEFFANLSPVVIGIEACATAHHWARTLISLGHEVKLIQPIRVKAFLGHKNKTDAADAKAICEALMHPGTQFVGIKTIEQQDIDHLLKRRSRLVEEQTRIINQTRAFLAERGIIIGQGISRFKDNVSKICGKYWEDFGWMFQSVLTGNIIDFEQRQEAIADLDKLIVQQCGQDPRCQNLLSIPGVGPLTSMAIVSQIGDARQFNNGRQLGAYLGLTPREHSSGGKQRLSGITKRGNRMLRTLLILCARAIMSGINRRKRDDGGNILRMSRFDEWVLEIKARLGTFRAGVAVANRLARIAWALLTRNEIFSVKKAMLFSKIR